MSRVAIIGAGITGITTAYTLAKLGYSVTVLDKNRDAPWKLRSPTAGSSRQATPKSGTAPPPS